MEEYRRLVGEHEDFWTAYTEFRGNVDLGRLDLGTEVFEGLRDPSSGREVGWRV